VAKKTVLTLLNLQGLDVRAGVILNDWDQFIF
jgi:hypothetical protein